MNTPLPKQWDRLLLLIYHTFKPGRAFHLSKLYVLAKSTGWTPQQLEAVVPVFIQDGFLKPIPQVWHDVPADAFNIYTVNPSIMVFVEHDGGYATKYKYTSIKRHNMLFQLLRHWVWFVGFWLSVVCNIYLWLSRH